MATRSVVVQQTLLVTNELFTDMQAKIPKNFRIPKVHVDTSKCLAELCDAVKSAQNDKRHGILQNS